jgi:hypothetical protein
MPVADFQFHACRAFAFELPRYSALNPNHEHRRETHCGEMGKLFAIAPMMDRIEYIIVSIS